MRRETQGSLGVGVGDGDDDDQVTGERGGSLCERRSSDCCTLCGGRQEASERRADSTDAAPCLAFENFSVALLRERDDGGGQGRRREFNDDETESTLLRERKRDRK